MHVHIRINYYQIWVTNRSKHGHFTFLLICPRNSRMTCILGRREYKFNHPYFLTGEYSLRSKIQVILGSKNCPKKQVTLPYLESVCACKNQLLPSTGNK